jgi:hypothetical protein
MIEQFKKLVGTGRLPAPHRGTGGRVLMPIDGVCLEGPNQTTKKP